MALTASSDTVFALASGHGRAGIAVLRLSGPDAGAALAALSGRRLPEPRRAVRVRLCAATGELLDDGLALWFPGPASFTGEDVVELHTHGGRAVVGAVSEALLALGLRPAEPGEFSRRAFENGKLDLTAAEAVADLVAAETAAQRRQALRQMESGLARLYDGWRDRLMRALAHLEAAIDFPDEELPPEVEEGLWRAVATLRAEVAAHLAEAPRGERLREGLHLAIVGAPNVGKSSLLNRLARRDAAIVSATAGTTRDVVEVHLDLGGYPVVVADTAGLREAAEDIEGEGIRRARARAESADLTLAVFDAARLPELDPHTLALVGDRALVVLNKADLAAVPGQVAGHPAIAVSAATGVGLDALEAAIAERAAALMGEGAAPVPTRIRHRAALAECLAALERAPDAGLVEMQAEDLRLAARALGRITGRVDVEDLLDVIFRDFCIGK
jgi:tRNA modification GTPase